MRTVRLGGLDQTVVIRGEDRRNPVLLFLHGGPGYSEIPYMRAFQTPLESRFTVVQWDQRGTGKSYSPSIPRESMTIQQFVSDTCQLAEWLRDRFHQRKIVLVGHSWGSIIGTLAVQRRPDLFSAYVGIGQVVDVVEGEKISYQFTLDQARRLKNKEAARELAGIGTPPYYNNSLDNVFVQRKWLSALGGAVHSLKEDRRLDDIYFSAPEYSDQDRARLKQGIRFSMSCLADQLLQVHLLEQAPKLEVPVFFLAGRYDYTTPFELTKRYFDRLSAPRKELIWFEHSSHSPHLEEPEKFAKVMIDRVLPAARSSASAF